MTVSKNLPRFERCENCKFFAGATCRRHPPVVDKDDNDWSVWPAVMRSGWCGEFAAKVTGGANANC